MIFHFKKDEFGTSPIDIMRHADMNGAKDCAAYRGRDRGFGDGVGRCEI